MNTVYKSGNAANFHLGAIQLLRFHLGGGCPMKSEQKWTWGGGIPCKSVDIL